MESLQLRLIENRCIWRLCWRLGRFWSGNRSNPAAVKVAHPGNRLPRNKEGTFYSKHVPLLISFDSQWILAATMWGVFMSLVKRKKQVCSVHEAFTFDSGEPDLRWENEQTIRKWFFFQKERSAQVLVSPHNPLVRTRCMLVATSGLNRLKLVVRSASSSGWISPRGAVHLSC